MNHYVMLGVCAGDSADTIKAAYLALAKANHPDLHDNDPEKAARMADINVAWNILSSAPLRRQYDKRMTAMYGTCATCQGKGFRYKQRGFKGRILTKCEDCGGAGTEKQEK